MDLPVTRDAVRVSEPVFDAVSDHSVDCDIILPDYCPDIARIIQTEAEASIDSKTIEVGRLIISGTFCVKIIYIPENSRNIRCVTHEEPYTHSFEIQNPGDKLHCMGGVKVNFANCRPVGPRRMQIRSSLAIAAKVLNERDEDFISGSGDNRVEVLSKPVMVSNYVGSVDKRFDVNEQLELGFGKPAATSVIKADATAVMQDYKLIANKVIAKGELLLRTLYAADNGEDGQGNLETMENSIPISQIIDLDGVDEECGCDVKFVAGVVKAEPKQDGDGENKIISVSLPVTASAKAWRTEQHNAACDAYSPQYEMNLKTKEINFEHMAEQVKANEIVRQVIDLNGMEIGSVLSSNAKANVTGVGFEDGTLVISGEMMILLFAMDQAGNPAGIEKSMPFSIKEELKNTSDIMRCEPEVNVVSTSYSLSGEGNIDMRVECAVNAMIYSISKETAITDMSLDEENQKDNSRKKTLTLYYADKGERIWDIAKRYNTSMDAVKRENNLETDSLEERSMLLIPKKHAARV